MDEELEKEELDDIEDVEDIDNDPETHYIGDNTVWKLLCKKYNEDEDYIDITTAMETKAGVVLRTYTSLDGETSESTCFIPGVALEKDSNNNYHIV